MTTPYLITPQPMFAMHQAEGVLPAVVTGGIKNAEHARKLTYASGYHRQLWAHGMVPLLWTLDKPGGIISFSRHQVVFSTNTGCGSGVLSLVVVAGSV